MKGFDGTPKVGYFLAGLGAGVVVALLLAPKTGKQSRRYIARKAGDGWDRVASAGKEIRDQAEDLLHRGKGLTAKLVQ